MTTMPAYYTAAKTALAKVARIDEAKNLHDKAHAMRVYAVQSKDDQLAAYATEIKMRALRRLGQLIEEQGNAGKLAKGTRGNLSGKKAGTGKGRGTGKGKTKAKTSSGGLKNNPPEETLTKQGIDKNLAHAARKAAKRSAAEQERAIAEASELAAAAADKAAIVKAARTKQQAEKRARRAKREAELASKIIALPDKRYGVVLADPEWNDEVWSKTTGMDRHASNHYPTSDAEIIAARDVKSIAAKDCVLFLWTTNQHLRIAIGVMEAWGFEYKSNYCWGKNQISTGRWNRSKHELLLIGTHGHVPCPAPGDQWDSLIMAAKGKHSEKPEEFHKMIEAYFPNIPKIELNARKARKGWDCWGAEAPINKQAAE